MSNTASCANSPIKNTKSYQHKRNKSGGSKTSTSSERIPRISQPHATKIIGVLNELKDDIVSCPQLCNESVTGSNQTMLCGGATSGTEDIYIERNGKFIKASKELMESGDLYTRPIYVEEPGSVGYNTPLDIAITIQSTCTTISRILLGLLGGVSLIKLLLVAFIHVSWEAHGQLALTEFYAVLVEISSTLYSIMFPICLVSLFDWLDLAHANLRHIVETVLGRKIFIVTVIYLISFFVFLLVVPYNDFIISLWTDKIPVLGSNLEDWMDTWKNLTLVFSGLCFVGWIITAVTYNEDSFYLDLISMKKYEEDEGHLTFENQLTS